MKLNLRAERAGLLRRMVSPHVLARCLSPCAATLLLAGCLTVGPQQARAVGEGADLELGGQGSDPGKFFELRDIAFDAANNLYALDGIAYDF